MMAEASLAFVILGENARSFGLFTFVSLQSSYVNLRLQNDKICIFFIFFAYYHLMLFSVLIFRWALLAENFSSRPSHWELHWGLLSCFEEIFFAKFRLETYCGWFTFFDLVKKFQQKTGFRNYSSAPNSRFAYECNRHLIICFFRIDWSLLKIQRDR